MSHLAQLVLVLDRQRHARSRGVVDTLKNSIDQVHSLLLKTEVLGQSWLREFDIQVDGLAGVGRRDGGAEEVVADVVEEYHALLSKEFDLEGRKQAAGVGMQCHPACLTEAQKGFNVVLDELLLDQVQIDALVG